MSSIPVWRAALVRAGVRSRSSTAARNGHSQARASSCTWRRVEQNRFFSNDTRKHFGSQRTPMMGPLEEENNHSSRSSHSPSWMTAANSWFPIRAPEEGTGFDNFLRKKQQEKPDESKKSSNNDDKTESDHKSKNQQDNNNNNNNSGTQSLSLLATLMFAAFLILGSGASSDQQGQQQQQQQGGSDHATYGADGQRPVSTAASLDIHWHEFLHLLEEDAIFKIVIHSGSTSNSSHHDSSHHHGHSTRARVYLKPGAQHLLNHYPSGARGDHANGNHDDDDKPEFAYDNAPSTMDGFDAGVTAASGSSATAATVGGPTAAGSTPLAYRHLRIGNAELFEKKLEEAQRALGRPASRDIPVQYTVESGITQELLSVLPWLLLSGFILASVRGAAGRVGGIGATGSSGSGGPGGMFGMGKSTAQKFTKEMNVGVNFSSVAGCDEAKKEIMEFVEFLSTPDRFTKLGAKIPKGALLCGPPGTGKTLLAKAVAGEANVPFYSLAGSEFLEMFVGVGPSRVRDLFREARENSPCIIFIDEIDSIGRKRGKSTSIGGNDERENTLNQLLIEMDGFDPSVGVVVLAGTNREDILDPALTRPGRFDRKISVDLPDIKGRKAIFKVHLKGITLETIPGSEIEEEEIAKDHEGETQSGKVETDEERQARELEHTTELVASRLAGLTPGFSGADIANICNEAAIVAARRSADAVTMEDFEKATDRVIGGLESNRIMSKEERSIVAYHEAGHAIAGWNLEHADPLLKVTIIPRASGALGFAQYLPKEVFLRSEDQIMDIVCMALAGRAAEEVFFGSVTTGASDDLRRVTQLVYSTIQLYGMNKRLGQLSFPKDQSAFWDERKYSEKTAKAMDEEAKRIVDAAYERTVQLIRDKKDQVEMVAQVLLEKETINHDDIFDLIGARPFKGDKAYDEYVSRRQSARKETEKAPSKEATTVAEEDSAANNLNPTF